jgi:hypothetical protein
MPVMALLNEGKKSLPQRTFLKIRKMSFQESYFLGD